MQIPENPLKESTGLFISDQLLNVPIYLKHTLDKAQADLQSKHGVQLISSQISTQNSTRKQASVSHTPPVHDQLVMYQGLPSLQTPAGKGRYYSSRISNLMSPTSPHHGLSVIRENENESVRRVNASYHSHFTNIRN